MADQNIPTPATPSAAYCYMAPMWAKVSSILGGTESMRAAGQEYLPKHTAESDSRYAERLACNTLLNLTQMTLSSWVGKPFAEKVQIKEDVPAEIIPLLEDIDMQGNNIDVFARNWFSEGVSKGFAHVLVDFPRPQPRADGAPRTMADDFNEKLRPYLVLIPPENLIFAYAEQINGVETLTHVRIRETVCQMVGWGEVFVNRIRVLTPGLVEIYEERKNDKNEVVWKLVDQYSYDLPYIPLATFYADRAGFMLSKPPLMDLVDLNIRHWQSMSDQIAVLTVARFPMLAVSGSISDDEIEMGPFKWLNIPDPSGRFYYVEHTGAAISAGKQDLGDLEEQMAGYGALIFLQRKTGNTSATSRALDSAETTSPLQDMTMRFEDAFESAMEIVADWMGLNTGGSYGISTDFGVSEEGTAQLQALLAARANGDISRERVTTELKRFGVLSQDFRFQTEQKLLDSEQASKMKAAVDMAAITQPKPQPGDQNATQPKPQPGDQNATQPKPQPGDQNATQKGQTPPQN